MEDDNYTGWVRGWMLGKYGKFVTPDSDEDWKEWIDGFKWGQTEKGTFERWIEHLEIEVQAHQELRFTLELLFMQGYLNSQLCH